MADFNKRFGSKKQEWTTPDNFYKLLNDEFNFEWDLAASETNTKCNKYFDINSNGLSQNWEGVCWLNPPYGDNKYKLLDWIKKAYKESQKDNCTVVMLIPARTNTKWWHNYCMNSCEVRFICGRPKFGDAKHGLPLPLAIIIFRKHISNTKFSSIVINGNK